jgi:Phosphotransferase system cellobiose-specific component IIA
MNIDELNQISMQIIMHAGNGRDLIKEALNEIFEGNREKCEEKLGEARKEITLSHNQQTKIIQESIENPIEINLLFTHAQDTLMTIESEYNLAKQLIRLYDKIESIGGCHVS